ncbi:HAAS signaling domain-containing protein [Domibacillus aminovorans]|uniref:DUF1700 domain-containing protein n=1 Tax=Domibacillus aminovorans TaxID=29332 RepID=A0A177L6C5_9BACI|nr:DUF1700 domain-containing protein [Domibacillus aminovorans]OAH61299.1 hypothetical protein AWH49_14025 [Domibacillus aminovorans]
MNKKQFLQQLDDSLQKLPHDERRDILQDYEEYFTIGLEEGKTEEEIAVSLGSPRQIGKELSASHQVEKAHTTATARNVMRAVWAVIGLGFFNLVIVLGPFIALVGVLAAGWAAGGAFVVSPLLVLFSNLVNWGTFQWFDAFVSIALCGIGLFIVIGMFFATKAITKGFLRYLKFNASLVKGGLRHD